MRSEDKFLDPKLVKENLLRAALYLVAYELLKDAIIDPIRDFFTFDFTTDGKPKPDKEYQEAVVAVHRDLLSASCMWLRDNGVITEGEVEEIRDFRKHRNQVAHDLPTLLIDPELDLNIDFFFRIRSLLKKIELWWTKNVEIPSNSEFDQLIVKDEDILPGRLMLLDYVIAAAQDV